MNKPIIEVDFQKGSAIRVFDGILNLFATEVPLFNILLRENNGETFEIDAFSASECALTAEGAEYVFDKGIVVRITAKHNGLETVWGIDIKNQTDMAVEFVDFPNLALKPLQKNEGIGRLLLPNHEGVIVDNTYGWDGRPPASPYPSEGWWPLFPNTMCSQFMAYLTDKGGLYLGAHDTRRGPKVLTYNSIDGGTVPTLRTYTGAEFSKDFSIDFPIVTRFFDGDWHDAADIYRDWFSHNLPNNIKKICDNKNLPEWYKDFPLIVAYPVRGAHDTDEMNPNAFLPYINALPEIEKIAESTGSRIMALLMHWEGTAPWAPPYVWPPYGGEESFLKFRDALHDRGHLLGVYCSGFGWTYQSNLTDYNCIDEWESGSVYGAMCAGPDGNVQISKICTPQKIGYDLCPVSEPAKEMLNDAFSPLFISDIDYAQILDQNLGGGQYFCYSHKHNHPPVPGPWMTENMQKLLTDWNNQAPNTLFGCESAATEPFMGNLMFSDNRYELNYFIGNPVPLYSYIYHEYVHNFMGNQCGCDILPDPDNLRTRMAYSFVAGDCLTVVMLPDGNFVHYWGCHNSDTYPDKEKTLLFIKNLTKFYKGEAKPYLLYGRMEKPIKVECDNFSYKTGRGHNIHLPMIFSTAWSYEGKKIQIFVNPTDEAKTCLVGDKTITVNPLDACMIEL